MKKQYQALSPDNIPINCEGAIYPSWKKAVEAIKAWAKNYEAQGYYSQVCYNGYRRQIPVADIINYCDIREL